MRIVRVLSALAAALTLNVAIALGAASKPETLDASTACGPVSQPHTSTGRCIEPTVAAYDGWVAWSHPDPSGSFQLALRSPQGHEFAAPVPERLAPFDVSLGPSSNGIVAVYSRCVNEVQLIGCRLVELRLSGLATSRPLASGSTTPAPTKTPNSPTKASGPEIALEVPLSGSLHTPAIWQDRIVFLRENRIYAWTIAAHQTTALSFPASDGKSGTIGGLSLDGNQVAFTTSPSGTVVLEGLWAQEIGSSPRFIEGIPLGQGAECKSMFVSPTIVGEYLYAFHQDCGSYAPKRWERYSLKTTATYEANLNLKDGGDNEIHSVVPDRGGVTWISPENGALLHLASVPWRQVARDGLEAMENEDCTLQDGCR